MKGALLCLGTLVATAVAIFVELIIVMATTGKSISAGERGVIILGALYLLTYLGSCIGTAIGVVKLEESTVLRVVLIVIYVLVLGAGIGFFGFISLIMFNR